MKSQLPFIDPRVKDAMDKFQQMTDSDVRSRLWGVACFKECKLVYAAPGKTIHQLQVTPEMTNFTGTLHGGCSATLIDITAALMTLSKAGYWDTGNVSRSLTVTFLKAAPVGTKVEIESRVRQMGKNLGLAVTEIKDSATGALLVFGTHDKVPLLLSRKSSL